MAESALSAAELTERLSSGQLTGEWTLDRARSEIRLHTKHTWILPLTGVFREVSGAGTVGADGSVSGTLAVAAASVDTGNARRDAHLRSADFFDVERHPDITFAVDSVTPSGTGARIAGSLTVRAATRPVAFDAEVSGPDGELWLTARVQVDRTEYGLTWNMLGIAAKRSELAIRAVFARG
jgi:polyisoprenoid-binding protein YceI